MGGTDPRPTRGRYHGPRMWPEGGGGEGGPGGAGMNGREAGPDGARYKPNKQDIMKPEGRRKNPMMEILAS